MFARLLGHPGVVEHMELRSRFGFLAFHGGSLERATEDIANAAAARCGASVYTVVQPSEFRWHVPSTRVDPSESSRLAEFVDHVDTVIAVHGFGRMGYFTSVLLGGQNRELASHVGSHLRAAMPHYDIVDDLEKIPRTYRGVHPDNPVNLVRAKGVQLELSPRIRGLGPYWIGWEPGRRTPHTEALIDGLVHAVQSLAAPRVD